MRSAIRTPSNSSDRTSLAIASGIGLALLGLAAFGGPHGTLGAAPWMALVTMALVQTAVWYTAVRPIRRESRGRSEPTG